jgi:hypothetical protein
MSKTIDPDCTMRHELQVAESALLTAHERYAPDCAAAIALYGCSLIVRSLIEGLAELDEKQLAQELSEEVQP